MISVGLLVDNSVVVAENIHRLNRAGLARREATIRGTGEIALAVVMATLTTVVVFLPVSLVGGGVCCAKASGLAQAADRISSAEVVARLRRVIVVFSIQGSCRAVPVDRGKNRSGHTMRASR